MEAALAGFDEADAEAEDQRLAGERAPPPGEPTEGPAAVVETQEPDRQLQRAGLQQRLQDLQAKQRRVQGALDAQQGTVHLQKPRCLPNRLQKIIDKICSGRDVEGEG